MITQLMTAELMLAGTRAAELEWRLERCRQLREGRAYRVTRWDALLALLGDALIALGQELQGCPECGQPAA